MLCALLSLVLRDGHPAHADECEYGAVVAGAGLSMLLALGRALDVR
ncbi:MAG TPA: hypothetical protein VMS31_12080 [Pyrinomonadaceae bacterium]|nr:hypothetical protein [Pyrinomonadaceae bacterium]